MSKKKEKDWAKDRDEIVANAVALVGKYIDLRDMRVITEQELKDKINEVRSDLGYAALGEKLPTRESI